MGRTRNAIGALAVAVAALAFAPACEPAPKCDTPWGSTAETSNPMTTASVTGVAVGRHDCYDRFVIDLRPGAAPGYSVSYVTHVVDEAGHTIALRGGAFLQISVHAPAYDSAGHSTYDPANPKEAANVGGFTTLRQVAYGGTFEGYSTFGLGARARLPFRVFVANVGGGGHRLAIDVAHSWT